MYIPSNTYCILKAAAAKDDPKDNLLSLNLKNKVFAPLKKLIIKHCFVAENVI